MQQDLYYEYYNLDLEKLDLNPLTWLNMKGNNLTFRKKGQPVLDPTSFLSKGNFKGIYIYIYIFNLKVICKVGCSLLVKKSLQSIFELFLRAINLFSILIATVVFVSIFNF